MLNISYFAKHGTTKFEFVNYVNITQIFPLKRK